MTTAMGEIPSTEPYPATSAEYRIENFIRDELVTARFFAARSASRRLEGWWWQVPSPSGCLGRGPRRGARTSVRTAPA